MLKRQDGSHRERLRTRARASSRARAKTFTEMKSEKLRRTYSGGLVGYGEPGFHRVKGVGVLKGSKQRTGTTL